MLRVAEHVQVAIKTGPGLLADDLVPSARLLHALCKRAEGRPLQLLSFTPAQSFGAGDVIENFFLHHAIQADRISRLEKRFFSVWN